MDTDDGLDDWEEQPDPEEAPDPEAVVGYGAPPLGSDQRAVAPVPPSDLTQNNSRVRMTVVDTSPTDEEPVQWEWASDSDQ